MKTEQLEQYACLGYGLLKDKYVNYFEKKYLIWIMTRHNGNVSRAAREAKVDRSNFLRLLKRVQISPQAFRQPKIV